MPVKFNIVARGKPGQDAAPKKYYPSATPSGRKTLRQPTASRRFHQQRGRDGGDG